MTVQVMVYSQEGESNTLTKQTVFIGVEDSIKLATNLYLPETPGPFPTILIRTPYNKLGVENNGGESIRQFLKNGWAVVAQDTRGKFESNGIYEPFMHERVDGLATLEWIRLQPWCSGKVAGWGGSYVGYTQWAIADQMDVITPILTSANMYELVYPEGLYSLATVNNWGLPNGSRTSNTVDPEKLKDSYLITPLSLADDSTLMQIDLMDQMLAHPHMDAYWGAMNQRAVTTCPVYSIAGWYDIFLKAQILDFELMEPYRHPDSRLIIGPYAHGQITMETDFGEAGDLGRYNEPMVEFIKSHFEVSPVKKEQSGPVKPYSFFIMHRNEWIDCEHWPPENSVSTAFYLHKNGKMSQQADREEKMFEYTYDPTDPYPSIGGTYLGVGVGPAIQNPNTGRTDQVIFESEVLEKPLVLLGPMDATLYAATDAPSTDFFVSLQEIRTDGTIINIQEGGKTIYADYRAAPLPRKNEISLWASGYQIESGHKIRVVISSSLFPRYNRNLNSGEEIFNAQHPRIANQKIYTGGKFPSHILLPVLNIN